MYIKLTAASLALALTAPALFAGSPVETELGPITHLDATLVIVGTDGTETGYTPAMLEELTTYSMTTTTPWREVPATFEGVLLADILSAHGLDSIPSIKVTAENNYVTTIGREVWEEVDILVATRVDGRAHSRRSRGPIQFVIDSEAFASTDLTSESNFVWMASRIEVDG
jgi:hypothetical protein